MTDILKPNCGVFDDDPDYTARKVARSLFERQEDEKRIAKAVGRSLAEVRKWKKEWVAQGSATSTKREV